MPRNQTLHDRRDAASGFPSASVTSASLLALPTSRSPQAPEHQAVGILGLRASFVTRWRSTADIKRRWASGSPTKHDYPDNAYDRPLAESDRPAGSPLSFHRHRGAPRPRDLRCLPSRPAKASFLATLLQSRPVASCREGSPPAMQLDHVLSRLADTLSQLDFGNVPSWLGAGSVFIALYLIRTDKKKARRAQAQQVSGWIERLDDKNASVMIRNGSDSLIYDIKVYVVRRVLSGPLARDGSSATELGISQFRVWPRPRSPIFIPFSSPFRAPCPVQ